jgi:hypothetical protein
MKRRFWIALAAFVVVASVVGWGLDIRSFGHSFNIDAADELVPAKTTYNEAVDLIGYPVKYERFGTFRERRSANWSHLLQVSFFHINLYYRTKLLIVFFDSSNVMDLVAPATEVRTLSILDGNKEHVIQNGFNKP